MSEKRPIKELLEQPFADSARIERLAARLKLSRAAMAPSPPAGRRLGLGIALTTAGLAALILAVWLLNRAEPAGLRAVDGRLLSSISAPASSAKLVSFADGSSIRLAAGTQVDVLKNTGKALVLVMERGRARYFVKPGGPRRWSVETGWLTVDVVGTEFTVERSTERVSVDVAHGIVRVRGDRVPGGMQRLTAGQRMVVAATAEQPVSLKGVAPRAPLAPPAPPAVRAVKKPKRQAAAALAKPRSAATLFAAADDARRAGRIEDAVKILRQILAEHGADPLAGTAAFTLGRLLLERKNAPRAAAAMFELALKKGLPAALSESALARIVEAHRQAGDIATARAAARRYLERYPQGVHAVGLTKLLSSD